ncbi:hypothetical protein C8J56DRAFT_971241, partial [Mycena floridula]
PVGDIHMRVSHSADVASSAYISSVIIYSFRAFSPLFAKGSACRFFSRSPLVTTSWHNGIRRQKGQRLVSLTMMIFLTPTSSMVDQLSKFPRFSACFIFLAFFSTVLMFS